MIGTFALSGYRSRKNGNCVCECPSSQRYSRSWYSEETVRMINWVNLLKRMEFKVTPDVVVVYLIATRQESLLNAFTTRVRNIPSEVAGFKSYFEAQSLERSGFVSAGINLFSGDPCIIGKDTTTSEQLLFPKELYKMAGNFMRNRICAFLEVLEDTYKDSDGSLPYSGLRAGCSLPRKVINALRGYNTLSTSINDLCSHMKALHASIMPDAVYQVDCCCAESLCRSRKFSSLKWDPGTKMVGRMCENDTSDTRERIGVREVTQYKMLLMNASMLKNRLTQLMNDCPCVDQMSSDIRDAFCAAMEIIMYVTCLTKNYYGAAALNLPQVAAANRLFFTDKVEQNGHVNNGHQVSCELTDPVQCVLPYRNMTPMAAICIRDYITTNLRADCGCCICDYRLDELADVLEYLNKNPYTEVLSFLLGEYSYQSRAIEYGKRALQERRSNGGVK